MANFIRFAFFYSEGKPCFMHRKKKVYYTDEKSKVFPQRKDKNKKELRDPIHMRFKMFSEPDDPDQ